MKEEARKAIRESLLSGYRHHSYRLEPKILDNTLYGRGDQSLADLLTLDTYADILGPEPLRAMKNSLICCITVISRSAIDAGVSAEVSFALSDYYINALEACRDIAGLRVLADELREMYQEQVRLSSSAASYSQPIRRALEYIHSNLYSRFRVQDAAGFVGLNPQYFSVLFRQELGVEPSAYIRQQKLREAKRLLQHYGYSVGECADVLGFSSASHFIQVFRKEFGITPARLSRRNP